jgi:hypothetical protein
VVGSTLERSLREFEPDLVGVSCMFSLTHRSTVNVCQMVNHLRPGVPIALGGVHVTNALSHPGTRTPMMADLPGVDIFFQGESELAFRDFVRITHGSASVSALSRY